MNKIRKGDEVIVLNGKNKGTRGTVLSVTDNGKLFVDSVNIIKKHTKPNPQLGEPGGIVEKESAIDASNVAIFNHATKKADRVGFKILDDGKKVRYFKSNGEVVDI